MVLVSGFGIGVSDFIRMSAYLERWSETFCVRNTPITESTTDPFHCEKRRSPVKEMLLPHVL